MLMGEFHHNIDEKSRLVIPTKYREELGESFVITRGIESCLYVYSSSKWNELVTKLDALPFTKKDARTFIRSFFSGASECVFDKQGRIILTDSQKKFAGITKECIILGVNDRLEIWDSALYDSVLSENEDKLENIAEHLFED